MYTRCLTLLITWLCSSINFLTTRYWPSSEARNEIMAGQPLRKVLYVSKSWSLEWQSNTRYLRWGTFPFTHRLFATVNAIIQNFVVLYPCIQMSVHSSLCRFNCSWVTFPKLNWIYLLIFFSNCSKVSSNSKLRGKLRLSSWQLEPSLDISNSTWQAMERSTDSSVVGSQDSSVSLLFCSQPSITFFESVYRCGINSR